MRKSKQKRYSEKIKSKTDYPLKQASTVLFLFILLLTWGCASSNDHRTIEQKIQDSVYRSIAEDILEKTGNADKEYLLPVYVAMKKKEYNSVINQAESLKSEHPNDEDLYYIQGVAYYEKGDYASALRYFEKTVSMNSNRGEAFYYKAVMLHQLDKPEPALNAITTAINNKNTVFQLMNQDQLRVGQDWTVEKCKARMFYLRAVINQSLRQRDNALSDINKAISFLPYIDDALLATRGEIYFYKNQYTLAYNDFQEVIKANSEDASPWELMGRIDTYRGHYDAAAIKFNKAAELEPERYSYALGLAGVAYWLKGDQNAAMESMGNGISKEPSFNMYFHLAYFHHLMGNRSQAQINFKKAEQLYPDVLSWSAYKQAKLLPKNSGIYTFYQQELKTAKTYLGANQTATANTNRTPTLKITSLTIDPDPVSVNTPFDIKISYQPDIPGAGYNELPIVFYFKIYKNKKAIFTSEEVTLNCLNGNKRPWKHHMDPVSRTGTYEVKAFVKYKNISDSKSITLAIK